MVALGGGGWVIMSEVPLYEPLSYLEEYKEGAAAPLRREAILPSDLDASGEVQIVLLWELLVIVGFLPGRRAIVLDAYMNRDLK